MMTREDLLEDLTLCESYYPVNHRWSRAIRAALAALAEVDRLNELLESQRPARSADDDVLLARAQARNHQPADMMSNYDWSSHERRET